MIPNLSGVFKNWFSSVQLRVVTMVPDDFEAKPELQDIQVVNMMITVMKAQRVERKPENVRSWKWWEGHSETFVPPGTVLADPAGLQFKIDSFEDWSQAGFYKYDLVQQPADFEEPS